MNQEQNLTAREIVESEVELAKKLIVEQKWSDAISLLEAAHQKHPLPERSLEMLADSYSRQKDYENAIRVYAELSGRQPSQAKWAYRLAFQYKMNKEISKAIVEYERCLQLYPRWLKVYQELDRLYEGKGLLNEARQACKQGIEGMVGSNLYP